MPGTMAASRGGSLLEMRPNCRRWDGLPANAGQSFIAGMVSAFSILRPALPLLVLNLLQINAPSPWHASG
jgi:hypothetical protein